nr:DUF2512 family protein [Bacillus piscicola]
MKHVISLAVKTILVMLILVVFLSFFNGYALWKTLLLSAIVIGASYLIGDLFVFPVTNNVVSTIADIVLNTLVIWLLGPFVLNDPVPFLLALVAALLIGACEWFYHKYVVNALITKNPRVYS